MLGNVDSVYSDDSESTFAVNVQSLAWVGSGTWVHNESATGLFDVETGERAAGVRSQNRLRGAGFDVDAL